MMARRLLMVVLACTVVCSLLAAIPSYKHSSGASSESTYAPHYRVFQPDVYPERLAKNVVPYELDAPHAPNDNYIVTTTDDVEIFVEHVAEVTRKSFTYKHLKAGVDVEFTRYDSVRLSLDQFSGTNLVELQQFLGREFVLSAGGGASSTFLLRIGLEQNGRVVWTLPTNHELVESDTIHLQFFSPVSSRAVAWEIVPTPMGDLPQDYQLTKSLLRTRLSIAIFDPRERSPASRRNSAAKWTEVEIITSTTSFKIKLNALHFTPDSIEFGTLRRLRSLIETDQGDLQLRVRLLPKYRSYATPGDTIRLYRMDREKKDDGTFLSPKDETDDSDSNRAKEEGVELVASTKLEPRVTQYDLQVDADGFVWLPPVQTSNDSQRYLSIDVPPVLARRYSLLDAAFFRVRVCHPGSRYPVAVEEIAEALSCRGADCGGNVLSLPCIEIDCDTHVFDNVHPALTELRDIRYQVQLLDLSWTLVTEGSQRLTLPFRRGLDLGRAIQEAYPRITGSRLDYDHESVAIVVIPDKDRNPSCNDEPFVLSTGRGAAVNPYQVVVLPGDIVFLQR